MARIKKQGLDYFPLDVNFMLSRPVRRVMKRLGDAAGTVLVQILATIYAGKGYYVVANQEFCEYLADFLYNSDADFVRRVIEEATVQDIFDDRLYREQGILTSAEVQRQYLFSTKRRNSNVLDKRFCLIEAEEPEPAQAPESTQNRPESPKMYTETAINAQNPPQSTHSIAQHSTAQHSTTQHSTTQHSTAQHSTADLLLKGSPQTGGTPAAGRKPSEGEDDGGRTGSATKAAPRRVYTMADVYSLQPPEDGLKRNLKGLLLNMELYHIPPQEQYAVVLRSNYGVIGHPVWQCFEPLRTSHGKIREPGKFLLSRC